MPACNFQEIWGFFLFSSFHAFTASTPCLFNLLYCSKLEADLHFVRNDRLVLETLDPLPEDRKCFRMINGVLVERTVKDVKPALQTNSEGLKQVLDDLVVQYKSKQDEMEKWKVSSGPTIIFFYIAILTVLSKEKEQRHSRPTIKRIESAKTCQTF